MGYIPDEEARPEESRREKSRGHGHKPKRKEVRHPGKRETDDDWGENWGEDSD